MEKAGRPGSGDHRVALYVKKVEGLLGEIATELERLEKRARGLERRARARSMELIDQLDERRETLHDRVRLLQQRSAEESAALKPDLLAAVAALTARVAAAKEAVETRRQTASSSADYR